MSDTKTIERADGGTVEAATVMGVVIRTEAGERMIGVVSGGAVHDVRAMKTDAAKGLMQALGLAQAMEVPVFLDEAAALEGGDPELLRQGGRKLITDFAGRVNDNKLDMMKFDPSLPVMPVVREQAGGGMRVVLGDPSGYFRKWKWQMAFFVGFVLLFFGVVAYVGIFHAKMPWPVALGMIPIALVALSPVIIWRETQIKPLERATWFVEVEGEDVRFPDGTAMKRGDVEGVIVCFRKSLGWVIEMAMAYRADGRTKFKTVVECTAVQKRGEMSVLAFDLSKRIGAPMYCMGRKWDGW
jgi:hypothetical protein